MQSRWQVVRAVLAVALVAVLASGPWAMAQEKFPSREITLIVPWPAGGGSDISMRLVAEFAQKQFGVPVVVVNKPGAAGAIGHRDIANARPDGYTIGMFGSGAIAQQYMIPNPVKLEELQPIVFFGNEPGALSVRADTPWKTLKEFVEAAKARPTTTPATSSGRSPTCARRWTSPPPTTSAGTAAGTRSGCAARRSPWRRGSSPWSTSGTR